MVALLGLICGAPALLAQSGADRFVVMAGTTTVDGQGRHWAYLAWQATEPEAIRARVFAVYAKPGDASAATPFERQAIVGIQTDPLVIQPLLQRSIQLGQDVGYLEQTINNLFEKLMPDPTLPLAEKLSAVIRGSLADPDHFKNLVLMARVHPAVGLCLGWAHAGLIPGPVGTPTTFELRAFDPAAEQDLAVLGRVTVRAGQPVVLPAPGQPVDVPEISPKGDLNARMRWATPDELRRLSMLQHGFNVYRVPRDLAEALNFHLAPPATSALLGLVAAEPLAHRLNQVPVLVPFDLTMAEAADLMADPATFFYSDWNDRFNPATTLPQDDFVNGAQFYYFLTARDLLGRDGLVSPGTLITICDRMPPMAPRRVRVVNRYTYDGVGSEQRLEVIWRQNDNTPTDLTTEYYVYRWSGLPELQAMGGNPLANLVAGPIPHLLNSPTNSYVDDGAGAPVMPADAGVTFWYTVVAVDNGACPPGGNRSPHSAPAFGVLRDRVGPDAGGGRLEITCSEPVVTFSGVDADVALRDLSLTAQHYRLTAERDRSALAWAEFFYEIPGLTAGPVFIGREWFAPEAPTAVLDFSIDKADLPPGGSPLFLCRVGAANGKVSPFASSSMAGRAEDGRIRPVRFAGTIQSSRTAVGGDCDVHDPHGGGDGTIDDICVTAFLTAGTKEVKFYRRVDNGPLTLLCQREADFEAGEATSACCDGAMPAQSSEICYFVQFFDEHGNAGPMVRVGCVQTAPNAPLPTPILSPLTPEGAATDARMRIEWFCPPYGVERFEVWIAGNPLPPAKDLDSGSGHLTLVNAIEIGMPLPGVPFAPKLLNFHTPRIGPGFGTGPTFSVEAEVVPGNHYAVFIVPVAKDGSLGPRSNVETFTWHHPIEGPVTDVPWPARPLPAVTLTNFPGVQARFFATNDILFSPFPQQGFEGGAIRVGALTMPQYPMPYTNTIAGSADPMEHVYRSSRDQGSLFPLAVYRSQVADADFPDVSGDLIQVTPLMEQIAYDHTVAVGGGDLVVVHDPFIRLVPKDPTLGSQAWELYLLDTQPVVESATYQYFLVRFHPETREIVEVMPTNPIHVTP